MTSKMDFNSALLQQRGKVLNSKSPARMAKRTIRHPNNSATPKHTTSLRKSILLAIIIFVLLLICTFFILIFHSSYYLQSFDDNSKQRQFSNVGEKKIINEKDKLPNTNIQEQDTVDLIPNSKSDANSSSSQSQPTPKATIAYAISLSGCPTDGTVPASLTDGAAVLKHSIHLSSIRNYPRSSSLYDYKMYAIVHPDAVGCSEPLETHFGYEILIRDVPVKVEDIEGDFLRERVPNNGCCGELEFIKLWAYTITDQPIVVHLDLDTIVLNPLDELFDAMLDENDESKKLDAAMWPEKQIPSTIDAFFTRDYNMVKAGKPHVGVQGGFIVIRSSPSVFEEYKSIIREGDFRQGKGWGGKGYGTWYGGMTFQGIVPYFYDELHPGTAVEVNRCIYNQMADNPRDQRTVNDVVSGNCRDGRTDCEDCRSREVEEVKTAHFTLCQKPWECLTHTADQIQHRLCRKLFHEWYRVRADLELSWEGKSLLEEEKNGNVVVVGDGLTDTSHFRGFCKSSGKKGYIPIRLK